MWGFIFIARAGPDLGCLAICLTIAHREAHILRYKNGSAMVRASAGKVRRNFSVAAHCIRLLVRAKSCHGAAAKPARNTRKT